MSTPCKITVYQIADVSTGHVTAEDGKKMGQDTHAIAQVNGGYGTIFYTSPAAVEHMVKVGYSAAMLSIVQHAQAQGIPYIRFDSDGAIIPDWPTFEW